MIVFCDAAFRPHLPGKPAWAGFAATAGRRKPVVLARAARRVPAEDSLEAELRAVRLALAHVVRVKAKRAVVVTDCLTAFGYLSGGRCRNPRHQDVVARIQALLPLAPGVRFRWVPREKNRAAHAICTGAAKGVK
ncbi:MAG: ribonuclease H-like domain-containing protein [Firmicutes bacterium]|nr:ribonuclease H-like domain-containing protein [Bacillota bacterium]